MILNGKAKELFYEWLEKIHHPAWVMMFEGKSQTTQNAYYIKWLDSVGVYVLIYPVDTKDDWGYNILKEDIMSPFYDACEPISGFNTRPEATTEAIKKANELINQTS
jgi:hypothetical protein